MTNPFLVSMDQYTVASKTPVPDSQKLEIKVIFTGTAATSAALKRARQCAIELGAQIELIYCQVVPRYFDFSAPPVSVEFMEQQLCSMASTCCPDVPVDVRICLCCHLGKCLEEVLTPKSFVILGGTRRWWRNREQRLADSLELRGHMVLFVDANHPAPILESHGNLTHANQSNHAY